MKRPAPFHQVAEQAVQAEDIADLIEPETIVWAKLRGYPWWPGRVKGFGSSPKELAQIAKTQHRPDSVVAVYFFGSHDFSLVPVESLRPFAVNWELFSKRSSSLRFNQALVEAQSPDEYRHFESASLVPGTNPAVDHAKAEGPARQRKGRPSKTLSADRSSRPQSRANKRPHRLDFGEEAFSQDHLMYCRTKLQKMLLRRPLKDAEMPISEKILAALVKGHATLETIRDTKIGVVLERASHRVEFASGGRYFGVGEHIRGVFRHWRPLLVRFMREVGMAPERGSDVITL